MIPHLRTIIKTACYEWKIQVRQRTIWMLAGLFFLVGWFSVDHNSLPWLSAISIAKSTSQGLGLFGSLFVVIVASPAFVREFQATHNFYWSRPFSNYDYIIGKYVGVCIAICTTLIPIGAWVAWLESTLHGLRGIVIQIQVWAVILVPTLMSLLAITLLVSLVLRRALWTSLVMVLIIGSVLALNLDVTHLSGFAPYGIYVSPLIGYGPDGRLLELHRVFYTELSFLTLILGLLIADIIAPRLERKSNLIRYAAGFLTITSILIMIYGTTICYRQESKALSTQPTYEYWKDYSHCSMIHSYQIDLTIEQATGHIAGKVRVGLHSSDTFTQVPVYLNTGLQITNISTSQPTVMAGVNEGVLSFTLPSRSRGIVFLTLEYAGVLHISRGFYDTISYGGERDVMPFLVGGYVDAGTVFLTRDGNWHPFPGCHVDTLTIKLSPPHLNSEIMSTTATTRLYSSDQLILTWEQPPLPLLIRTTNYRTVQLREDSILLVAPDYMTQEKLNELYTPYAILIEQIDTHLRQGDISDSPPSQIAILPLIKYGRYDPVSRSLFLPERDSMMWLYERLLAYGESGALDRPDLLYSRWVAERMMRLWWCSDIFCSTLQVYGPRISFQNIPASIESDKTTLNALISYAALRLVEPLVGQEFIDNEINIRGQMIDYTTFVWTSGFLPLASESPATNRIMIRLNEFWNEHGADAFWNLARNYHYLYGTTSLPEDEFENFVEQVTGVNLP